MPLDLVRNYERALEKDKKLRIELAHKKEELEELKVILNTDYVDLLEQAHTQYNNEVAKLQQKRDSELCALIEQIIREKELNSVPEILKILHKLKNLRPKIEVPKYFLKERDVYLSNQKRYLGEDVKKWTAFMRSHFYTFLFQLRTLFGEEADLVIRENALVPRLIGEYLSVVRKSLATLKSSLEYSTLWTLLSLTDRALYQVGAPFIVLLVPFVREAYVRHLMVKGVTGDGGGDDAEWDVMACLNEWRHFRPSFATTAIRLQITRRLAKKEYTEEQMTKITEALKKLSGDDVV